MLCAPEHHRIGLVPPSIDRGIERARDEAHKVLQLSAAVGIDGRIRHVMIPGMIAEDGGRPFEMKPKLDVSDFWSIIQPELSGEHGLCTQVTAFLDEPALHAQLTGLGQAGFDGIIFVGVPRTMNDGEGAGVAPTDALSKFDDLVDNRGVMLIPTREGEQGRFAFNCDQGASFGMTQLLYSDAVVGFLREFAKASDHRAEVLLSFGFVPRLESKVGLINWLIQDPGNGAVAAEPVFISRHPTVFRNPPSTPSPRCLPIGHPHAKRRRSHATPLRVVGIVEPRLTQTGRRKD